VLRGLLIVFALLGQNAHAIVNADIQKYLIGVHYDVLFQETLKKIPTYNFTNDCTATRNLLQGNEIKIQISLGYYDGFEFAEDYYQYPSLKSQFTKPCENSNTTICGFQITSDTPLVMQKSIVGPDRHSHNVILSIDSSSYSDTDSQNKTEFAKQQTQKSDEARQQFIDGFGEADIMFYVGHSRDGGGPDFFPPVLTSTGHVNYPLYLKNQAGVHDMNEGLDQAAHQPKVIGLFSCQSSDHFLADLKTHLKQPTSLFLTTALTEVGYESMLVSLDEILSFQCDQNVNSILKQYKAYTVQTL
jgi:hypothetical protein